MDKYEVKQNSVDYLLGLVRQGQVAIPELQRPFVWNSTKVRDLLDSLYKGYPVGYLITWQSPGAALKDGSTASYQQILIDGQQRITALRAAIAGLPIVDKQYRKVRISIAFNPVTQSFETTTPIIRKDPQWIADVSEVFSSPSIFGFMNSYLKRNPNLSPETVEANVEKLLNIANAQIGIISLSDELDVETVSEVFIRINSKGVPLSSADFAMSKIATYGERGRLLRKLIDYFCHLAVAPHVYDDIVANDQEFATSSYLSKIAWLRNDSEDLYDPSYSDMIRVATLAGFGRGRPAALVSELSGRDPETRTFDSARIEPAYNKLENTLLESVKQYHYDQFLMTIKSAGFIQPTMIVSKNALNFAYALYLILRRNNELTEGERKSIAKRWFVLSMLTNRHSGSFETTFEQDIRRIRDQGAANYLKLLEESELSDSFWEVGLPANLDTSSVRSPYFQTFLAAQVKRQSRGFLSKSITVANMQEGSGDIHHIVPRDYLKKNGYPDRGDYNQVANYVLTETPINIRISNRSPAEYMAEIEGQISSGQITLGEITNHEELARNLTENAVPELIGEVDAAQYPSFLASRRRLMAAMIRNYYKEL